MPATQNKPPYYNLEELFDLMDPQHRTWCQKAYEESEERFETSWGSSHNHQTWPGGYMGHIEDVLNYAVLFYFPLYEAGRVTFNLSSALFVLFFHDIEKPWRRLLIKDVHQIQPVYPMLTKKDREQFRNEFFTKRNIFFTPEEANAMRYVEGEHTDYSPTRRASWPLAAFCHMCDTASARISPEHPKIRGQW